MRVAAEEIDQASRNAWVVAVRPGFVDTPSTRALAHEDPALYPRALRLGANIEKHAVSPAVGAKRIWDALPPPPKARVLSFDGDPLLGVQIVG